MSQEPEFNPERAREGRTEGMQRERRRRRPGTINRGVQMKLDIFEPAQLDLDNYVYRWCNDEDNRLAMLTRTDDYDKVPMSSLKDFSAARSAVETDSEGDSVRMVVGTNKGGGPIYSYLLRKPRDYWEADQQEMVDSRQAMMEGRVYRAEADTDDESKKDTSNFYVPTSTNVEIGGPARRRQGPINRTTKGL